MLIGLRSKSRIYRTSAASPLALPLGELAAVRLTERVPQSDLEAENPLSLPRKGQTAPPEGEPRGAPVPVC